MGVINFIIENILTQASITIALIAMLGLLLQKKSAGQVISGTLKTLLQDAKARVLLRFCLTTLKWMPSVNTA